MDTKTWFKRNAIMIAIIVTAPALWRTIFGIALSGRYLNDSYAIYSFAFIWGSLFAKLMAFIIVWTLLIYNMDRPYRIVLFIFIYALLIHCYISF
jgi:hypothetical protein